jgi:hypothetical protein
MTAVSSDPHYLLKRLMRSMIRNQIEKLIPPKHNTWTMNPTSLYDRLRQEANDKELEHIGFPRSVREMKNFYPVLRQTATENGWELRIISETHVDLVRIVERPKITQQRLFPDGNETPSAEEVKWMAYEYGLAESENGLVPVFRFLPDKSTMIPREQWHQFVNVLDSSFGVPVLQRVNGVRIIPPLFFARNGWEGTREKISAVLEQFDRTGYGISVPNLKI